MCLTKSNFRQNVLTAFILVNYVSIYSMKSKFLKRVFNGLLFRLRSVTFILEIIVLHMDN